MVKEMIQTHYLPVYEPDPYKPKIIGYNVWMYIGHVLLGQIQGSEVFVKTKKEAQKVAKQMRDYYNK